MKCIFSEPVVVIKSGEVISLVYPTGTNQNFQFSKMECEEATTTSDIYELVENQNYQERKFFVEKTFSYGDALIVFFLTLFLIGIVAKGIFNFFWEK
jgi:maltodextrin utilization protein YvdJ